MESGPDTHLYDGGLAHMLRGWGTIQHSIAVWSPLDVAQPPGPVGIAHQVGVESDGVVAGIACRQNYELWIRWQQGLRHQGNSGGVLT